MSSTVMSDVIHTLREVKMLELNVKRWSAICFAAGRPRRLQACPALLQRANARGPYGNE